jgi:hypothetical protein
MEGNVQIERGQIISTTSAQGRNTMYWAQQLTVAEGQRENEEGEGQRPTTTKQQPVLYDQRPMALAQTVGTRLSLNGSAANVGTTNNNRSYQQQQQQRNVQLNQGGQQAF